MFRTLLLPRGARIPRALACGMLVGTVLAILSSPSFAQSVPDASSAVVDQARTDEMVQNTFNQQRNQVTFATSHAYDVEVQHIQQMVNNAQAQMLTEGLRVQDELTQAKGWASSPDDARRAMASQAVGDASVSMQTMNTNVQTAVDNIQHEVNVSVANLRDSIAAQEAALNAQLSNRPSGAPIPATVESIRLFAEVKQRVNTLPRVATDKTQPLRVALAARQHELQAMAQAVMRTHP